MARGRGKGHKQRCTVPKPEWTNVMKAKNTKEKESNSLFHTHAACGEHKTTVNNKTVPDYCSFSTACYLLRCFTRKLAFLQFWFTFLLLEYKSYMLYIAYTRDLWYPVITQSLEIEVDIKCVEKWYFHLFTVSMLECMFPNKLNLNSTEYCTDIVRAF